MPRRRQRPVGCWVVLALVTLAAIFGWPEFKRFEREHPERFPWTDLRLKDPIGPFTGIKLAALANDPRACLGLLRDARLAEVPFQQPMPDDPRCIFTDGVRIRPESGRSINYAPDGPIASCPVAAALALWERDVLQPAARRHFRTRVIRIDHAGSYSCRRLYGKAEGRFSEHATADAIDILGFRLANGRQVTMLHDWRGDPAKAAFLREVRDGACQLFATVLSPDYNRAHTDHFHLDQADRGPLGWRLCR